MEAEQKNIVIKNLSKAFGEDFVLKELSLTLFDGHTYCLMAPSGAGKTTLFRILMGLESRIPEPLPVLPAIGSLPSFRKTGF